ncbi:MAG: HAMP domain-containing histidine kinase [Myxococcales bacterium]|nr:HAMP domain-containing histidine kinase [Myxococcales bacterium]
MRSRLRDRSRTLVGRVATVAAIAAVGGGALASVAVLVFAETAITAAEARRLRDESDEILLAVKGLEGDALAKVIADERRDLAPAGLRLAVYRDGALAGGDAAVPIGPDGCAFRRAPYELHYCVSRSGPLATVVAANEAPGLGVRMHVAIVIAAIVIAAAIGALASRSLAWWAVGPLARLRARVGDATMDEAVNLGEDEGVREIDALRRTLRALLDRRAEALRAARLFAAGAAHELRTPLTTLSGELELLGEDPLPPAAAARIAALRETTARIGSLVERLLMLSRIGADEAMRHDAVELSEVLDHLVRRLPPDARARLSIDPRAPRATGTVRGDESLLAVLCENVVANALAHARPAAVTVTLDERGGDVVLDVIDDGPGIPEPDRARLFEPFARGATDVAGAGLGLALVAQIARAHGGKAQFVNAARGTHVEVTLPMWTPRDTR